VPWTLEIRDLWPESIVVVGAIRSPRLIRLLEWLEAWAYRKADRIIVVTDAFREYMVRRGIAGEKIVVIKNGVDLDRFTPSDPDALLLRRMNLQGKFIATYFGTHGMAHNLRTVLEAAELLRDRNDIALLMVGDGAERASLLAEKKERGLQNVVMLPQQAKDQMPSLWALSNVSMVLLRKSKLFKTVIPSKIFESMAMQRPIVLGVDGEARELIEDAQAGVFVEPDDPAALAHAIVELSDDEHRCVTMGVNGRRYVGQFFDRRRLAEVYLKVLAELARQRVPQRDAGN
jgi:glycosyltransferase involved in cell wall biosynthesis